MDTRRAIVSMLRTPRLRMWKTRLEELKELALSAGYIIAGELIQTKPCPISSTLFGKGKIEELKIMAEENNVDTLIVWNTLKSIQKFNLERFVGVSVVDRYELVLEIFRRNAGDQLAKLQIELALLEKLIPYYRLRERLIHGSRDKPYFRAGGEYGWVPKVAWLRKRRKKIREEIEDMLNKKVAEIRRRKELGFRVVTLVGYYNAGKTSIFNRLTGETKPVSPAPFTTLSSKYSRLIGSENVLLVDTIGFVSDLDPRIISSFRINLEDMTEADMLVWVVDISDRPEMLELKISATARILKNVGLMDKDIIVAANKVDIATAPADVLRVIDELISKFSGRRLQIIPCSALSGRGLEMLASEIMRRL